MKGRMVAQQAREAFLASVKGLVEFLGEEESDQLAELLFRVFHYFSEREVNCAYQSQWKGDEEA